MPNPSKSRLQMGCGEPQCASPRRLWDPSRRPLARAVHLRCSRIAFAGLLEERGRTQPIGLPGCGSVFRNSPGNHAARLIKAAGLKGTRQDGAQVSEKHANFIINTGDANAGDISRLIARVQSEVERTSGVRLAPEVRRVGG